MTPVCTRPGARMVGGLLAAAILLLGGSPAQDGKSVKVAVSLHIINLASIDEIKEQFEIDGYLMARWIDARLAFTPTRPTDTHHEYNRTRSGFRALKWSMPSRRASATIHRQRVILKARSATSNAFMRCCRRNSC